MVRAPDHEEDECSVLVDEGEEPKELEKELRQTNKKMYGQLERTISFSASRLGHYCDTSHLMLDRATLLYAMIKKKNVDVEWIIYNTSRLCWTYKRTMVARNNNQVVYLI